MTATLALKEPTSPKPRTSVLGIQNEELRLREKLGGKCQQCEATSPLAPVFEELKVAGNTGRKGWRSVLLCEICYRSKG